jgi:hypothetical protein
MKKIIPAITAIIAISFLLLGGCGEDKVCPASCDDGNPCSTDTCSKETDYECSHTPIPGCTPDCPTPCMGPAGMYMEMTCDAVAKQCASDAKAGLKITTSSITNEMLSMGSKFKVITTYDQPFNMKKDLFNMRISLSTLGQGISNIMIKSAELIGTDPNRQTVTLGQKTINKYLWSTETVVEDDLQVDFITSENDGSFTNVKVRINYEQVDFITSENDGSFTNVKVRINYDYQQTYAGQTQSKTGTFEITLRGVTFTWFKPSITQQCPASCDDGNAGTSDICNAATDFFCTHQPIPGRCGNFVCDPTENQCTCEADCGPCSGDAGQYLSFLCANNECKTTMKSGVIQQPVSKLDEKNRNFYYLQNTYTYNTPFNVNTDTFNLEFNLYNKQDAVSGVKIVEAKLLDQTSEVASVSVGEMLNSIGSTLTAEMPVTTFVGHEDDKTLNLRVDVEYQYTTATGTELRRDNFLTSLGKITLMNPTYP